MSHRLLMAIGMICCLCGMAAYAADQVVVNNADSGAGTLRQAIADVGSGETITFNLPSGSETNIITSELALAKSLTIDGANLAGSGAPVTVQVTAPGSSAWRVFNISGSGNTITISNLTIKGGSTGGAYGGAMSIAGATVNLNKIVLSDSKANYGGGIIVVGGGILNVTSSIMSNNATTSAHGGWIYNEGGALNVASSIIVGNTAAGCGGGIFNATGGGRLTMTATEMRDNDAPSGGGIYNEGTVAITNSTISGNSAVTGGGILTYGGITLDSSTISGNTASSLSDGGGGIYNHAMYAGKPLELFGTNVFSGNSAASGKGNAIYNYAGNVVNLNGSILKLAEDFPIYRPEAIACGTSTVDYNGATQTIAGATYYNLVVGNTGLKTVDPAAVVIGGAGTINDSAQVWLHVSAAGSNKVYDGTTAAHVMLALTNIFTAYSVTPADSYTAAFADRHAGDGRAVSVSNISLTGADAAKFTLNGVTTNSTSANITLAPLTITASNVNKTFGTALAFTGTEVTNHGLFSPDTVTHVTLSSTGTNAAANAGAYPITATNALGAGLSNYTIVYGNGTLNVVKADQTITNFPNPGTQLTTNVAHLFAQASSGLPVTNFTVISGPATIADLTNVTFSASGSVSIVASQAGNTNWNAAPSVTNTFTVLPVPEPPASDGLLAISVTPVTGSWSLTAPAGYAGPAAGTGNLSAVSAPTGSYSLTWGVLSGYTAPANQTQPVTAGSTTVFAGVYTALLPAPTGLVASAGRYADKVILSWNTVAAATSYQVWRGESGEAEVRGLPCEAAVAKKGQRADVGERIQIGTTSGTTFSDTTAAGGAVYYYWVKAVNAAGTSAFSDSAAGWRRTVGYSHYLDVDLDGDGKMDLVVYDPVSGAWYAKLSKYGYALLIGVLGGPDGTPVHGDYDGDGLTDVGIYTEVTGTWEIMLSTLHGQLATELLGGIGQAPVPGDFDGDRTTDIGVYAPANGNWTVKLSSVGYAEAYASGFGGALYLPVQRDYDGDRKHDPAVYHTTNGDWYVMLSGSGHLIASALGFGGTGYTPVPGDYDGDGLGDPGVYQAASGNWYVMLSGSGYLMGSILAFGGPTHTAMPGDYDGDGKTDPAVYNFSTGEWAFALTGSGYAMFTSVLGGPGEDPVGLAPAEPASGQ